MMKMFFNLIKMFFLIGKQDEINTSKLSSATWILIHAWTKSNTQ